MRNEHLISAAAGLLSVSGFFTKSSDFSCSSCRCSRNCSYEPDLQHCSMGGWGLAPQALFPACLTAVLVAGVQGGPHRAAVLPALQVSSLGLPGRAGGGQVGGSAHRLEYPLVGIAPGPKSARAMTKTRWGEMWAAAYPGHSSAPK